MAITHLRSAHTVIILCDICYSKITHQTRMHCPTCILDLCINCFHTSNTNHTNTFHSYILIEPLTFHVTDWPALDDILLIEALEMYGIGNWHDISEFVNKTQDIVEHHFCKYYNISFIEQNKSNMPALSNPNLHIIASYMPNRGDFDNEVENEFESLFKELNCDGLYDSLDSFRVELFDAFYMCQKRRALYKFHIFEKNLVNMQVLVENENALCDWESRILHRIKPLMQFVSKNDFNRFFIGLCIEEMIKNKIDENRRNIKMGFLEYEKKRSLFMSDNEREMCILIRLSFKEYLKVKEIIVWDALKTGYMDYKRAMAVTGCNDRKLQFVVDFFKANDWI